MEYRNFGGTYYLKLEPGDEVVGSILRVCADEGIESATFSGIGGCGEARILVFSAETGGFTPECAEGVLELVSLNGNVFAGADGARCHHAHALFSYLEDGEHRVLAGHLDSATVRYTAEIELRPVVGGVIGSRFDPETGTSFWHFA